MAVQYADPYSDDDLPAALPPRTFRDVTTDTAQHWQPRTFRPWTGAGLYPPAPVAPPRPVAPPAPALRHVTQPVAPRAVPRRSWGGVGALVAGGITLGLGLLAWRGSQTESHVAPELRGLLPAATGTIPAGPAPAGASAAPTTINIYNANVNVYTDKPVQVNGPGSSVAPPQAGGGGDLGATATVTLPEAVPTTAPIPATATRRPAVAPPTEVIHYVDKVQTVPPAVPAPVPTRVPTLVAHPTEVLHGIPERVKHYTPPTPTPRGAGDNPANW